MSTETTRVSSYVRAEGFYDSAGTMYQYASAVNNAVSGLATGVDASALNANVSGLTAGAAALNALLFSTSKLKVAFGSTIATDAVVMSSVTNCGLSTALYVFVNPQVTGIIAAGLATQTGVKWNIVNSTGVATQATCDYMIVGNA